MKIQTILNYFSILTLLVSTFMVLTVTYWSAYPYKPLEIKEVRVLDEEVNAGGFINYEIEYCKNIDLTATVSRAFINGVIFTTPTIITNNPLGCHKNVHQASVPSELPSGTYSLRSIWSYHVNPIREVTVTNTTNTFKVLGSDLDRQQDQQVQD